MCVENLRDLEKSSNFVVANSAKAQKEKARSLPPNGSD